eukprot:CAMPEP_0185619900 /NCGR_PEP_ID=MMETSP0436-20130131/52116_1 /TAXON_ID=626734 ORGANISM="Favella taraikaensis, Strain Fe Narragansett Bay" /NCGR_SAMPLE_ID=MMETSP0436 /ASSEMBLY_ACC=CAM_ASM_000390 /LENGTH=34 /DNA_ID= /DNA_START= /DNA_END= /DNA_ORIENTATION=
MFKERSRRADLAIIAYVAGSTNAGLAAIGVSKAK